MKKKDFNGTPHFGSLQQGKRRIGRKNFKRPPHPCPLTQSGEGRMEMKRFKQCSLSYPLQ
jgi:hypothetical protein